MNGKITTACFDKVTEFSQRQVSVVSAFKYPAPNILSLKFNVAKLNNVLIPVKSATPTPAQLRVVISSTYNLAGGTAMAAVRQSFKLVSVMAAKATERFCRQIIKGAGISPFTVTVTVITSPGKLQS